MSRMRDAVCAFAGFPSVANTFYDIEEMWRRWMFRSCKHRGKRGIGLTLGMYNL